MSLLLLPHLKFKPLNFKNKDTHIAWLEYQVDRLKWQLVMAHKSKLEPFMERYREKEAEAAAQTNVIREKIIALRRQLRSGEIDNKQYQKQLTPLKREKKKIAAALNRFVYCELDDFIPARNITPDEIAQYLEETRDWEQWLTRFKKGIRDITSPPASESPHPR